MKEITFYELNNSDKLYEFFKNAYVNNEDVLIPQDLVGRFTDFIKEIEETYLENPIYDYDYDEEDDEY